MKVTVVKGSARKKSNSSEIVNAFCEGLADGTEIKEYEMQKLNASGCIGCMACKGKVERCAIKDDLTEVHDEMHESDVLVLSSPVYFGDVNAQTKTFIDRLYHLFTPDFHDGFDEEGNIDSSRRFSRLKEGTKLVFIIAQGAPDPSMYGDIQEKYERFLRFLGFDEVHILREVGDPGYYPQLSNAGSVLEQARELGRSFSA